MNVYSNWVVIPTPKINLSRNYSLLSDSKNWGYINIFFPLFFRRRPSHQSLRRPRRAVARKRVPFPAQATTRSVIDTLVLCANATPTGNDTLCCTGQGGKSCETVLQTFVLYCQQKKFALLNINIVNIFFSFIFITQYRLFLLIVFIYTVIKNWIIFFIGGNSEIWIWNNV